MWGKKHDETPRSMTLASSESAAGSSLSQVLMRANAHPHRKLKGGKPFGRIIPLVPAPSFFMVLLDWYSSKCCSTFRCNRDSLIEKMKELSIPGFIPFILHKWHSHFIYQCNISSRPLWRSCIIPTVKSSIKAGVDLTYECSWEKEKEKAVAATTWYWLWVPLPVLAWLWSNTHLKPCLTSDHMF